MAGLVKRGQIWIINLEPGFGREIHKKRPAVVISNNELNKISQDIIIIPSSSITHRPSKEIVDVSGVSGFDKHSVLLPLLIRSIDEERLIKKVGDLPEEKVIELEEALRLVLGMVEI